MSKFVLIITAFIFSILFFSCENNSSSTTPNLNYENYAYTYSIFAGGQKGNSDGKLKEAKFNSPNAMAIDSKDNIYVVDRLNSQIRIITPEGEVKTLRDINNKPVLMSTGTYGIAVDKIGNIYTSDFGQIFKTTPAGEKTVLCGSSKTGYADGIGEKAQFDRAEGIFLLNEDLFVADLSNYMIRKVKLSDKTVSTYAGIAKKSIAKDGSIKEAILNSPSGISADSKGNLYITEYFNSNIRKIGNNGQVETLAGGNYGGFSDGIGNQAVFNNPRGILSTSNGYLFVADLNNNAIRLITPTKNVKTIYKSNSTINPQDIVIDSKGNLFFSESNTNTIVKLIRK